MPLPEDKQGFTGFYYHDFYSPVLCQRSHSYDGSWRSLKRYIEESVLIDLKNSSAWTLDPGKQWKWRR